MVTKKEKPPAAPQRASGGKESALVTPDSRSTVTGTPNAQRVVPSPEASPQEVKKEMKPVVLQATVVVQQLTPETLAKMALKKVPSNVKLEEVLAYATQYFDYVKSFNPRNAAQFVAAHFMPGEVVTLKTSANVGALITGALDMIRNLNKDKEGAEKDIKHLGAVLVILKDGDWETYNLPGHGVHEYDQCTPGNAFTAFKSGKGYELLPAQCLSVKVALLDQYNTLLPAATDFKELADYKVIGFEAKIPNIIGDVTNPRVFESGDMAFTLVPIKATPWNVSGIYSKRQYGEIYLPDLGEAELNAYRQITDPAKKAGFLAQLFADQTVYCVGSIQKGTYDKFGNLKVEVAALILRPDSLDEVIMEARPAKVEPLVGTSTGAPPAELKSTLASLAAALGTSEEDAQHLAMERQEVDPGMGMLEAAKLLLAEGEAEAAKVAQKTTQDSPAAARLKAVLAWNVKQGMKPEDLTFEDYDSTPSLNSGLKLSREEFAAVVKGAGK